MIKRNLPLKFPQKIIMGVATRRHRRALIAGGHICLALNPFTVFVGGLPVAGTLAAAAIFLTAHSKRDGLETDAIKQGLNRVIVSISLLFLCILSIQAETLWLWPAQAWVALALIQTPLGLYDAWSIWQGKLGLTLRGHEKF